jgi:probable rRNA maturation factor
MPVRFFQEETDFTPDQKNNLKKWIKNVIERENASPGEINYIFCSDEYLLQVNKHYLGHDYYTDIITFDQSDGGNTVQGDIYISIERVKENAKNTFAPFEEELRRVMIHGILHLLGFADHSDEDKKKMREKEDACLSLYRK